ncbi:hypothetical protein L1987_32191 [Smallanthus sonchifolius]|uniref:Uncharacterized protein n=1 Tax=Smallanthus sonchifolius TaxID=185202 RepID=A0ACB9I6Z7_9ASTR|nr:hypothetical protein L1987_32191 [Smallanthus sonchifolius]
MTLERICPTKKNWNIQMVDALGNYPNYLQENSRKYYFKEIEERGVLKKLSCKKKEVGLLSGDLKELDMHSFDFNLFSCLHFAKPELPTELREKIFQATSDVRKWWRKQEQLPSFCGLSKSVAKRRAKKYGRCRKCGNWSHDRKCNKNQTWAQSEYTYLIEVGAIRRLAEWTIRKGSNFHYAIRNELFGFENTNQAKSYQKHQEFKILEGSFPEHWPPRSQNWSTIVNKQLKDKTEEKQGDARSCIPLHGRALALLLPHSPEPYPLYPV